MSAVSRGFTLVEVLVALVIVAAGAAALMSALNTAAASAGYLRDRTFAQWVGTNRIVETRLKTTPPQNGRTEGQIEFGGQRWAWREQITDAQVPGLRRIDVSVRPIVGAPPPPDKEPDWTATVSGAISRDVALADGTMPDWEPPPAAPSGNPPATPGAPERTPGKPK